MNQNKHHEPKDSMVISTATQKNIEKQQSEQLNHGSQHMCLEGGPRLQKVSRMIFIDLDIR